MLPSPIPVPLLPKLRGQFAEFLNEGFLARLRIFSSPTCGGLRYGHLDIWLEAFLGSVDMASSLIDCSSSLPITPRKYPGGFSCPGYLQAWTGTTNGPLNLSSCVPPSLVTMLGGIGMSTDCPSPTLYASA